MTGKHFPTLKRSSFFHVLFLILFLDCAGVGMASDLLTTGSEVSSSASAPVQTNSSPHFIVRGYAIEGKILLSTNFMASLPSKDHGANVSRNDVARAVSDLLTPLLSKYTGTNVSEQELVQAAADLQAEYRNQGYPKMIIAIAPERMTNGIITMNVFQGAVPQILVSGSRCLSYSNNVAIYQNPPTVETPFSPQPANAIAATTSAVPPAAIYPPVPSSSEEIAAARAAMLQKMAELDAQEKDTRIHVISTNAGPRFEVKKYLVMGNSVLTPQAIAMTLTNIDGAFGTNVSFDGIRTVVAELQDAYHDRGYVTVAVRLPQQKLTNATVKLQVLEGRLATIHVTGNRYFSSNNVMRALPSLHTNMVLNGPIFQAELNQANANQDRQIYPIIGPGPDPGTSDLTLKVKDQLPVHAKTVLNNESSPGTPDLRVNSSAVIDNLWQRDNSLGLQYNFSPEAYKTVAPEVSEFNKAKWDFYDQPLVATYSGFYRLPLGGPKPVEDVIAQNPGTFGYDEATRKFNLPPPASQSELTFFASRATIDTGLTTLSSTNLYTTNGNTLSQNTVQQDLTKNNDFGFRLAVPLPASADFHQGLSGGLDFKMYQLNSYKTNVFLLGSQEIDYEGNDTNTVGSTNTSPVPVTDRNLEYLPLSLRYDATLNGSMGVANLGLGITGNPWYSGSLANLQNISGSKKSSGHWITLNPSFSWSFAMQTNWLTTVRADGQWASEPLISNEQFGIGGVNSVRGYREGAVFGDTGWHVSLEQQTPPHVVGIAYGNTPLIIRGSVYMDYAKSYLLDSFGPPVIGPPPHNLITYPSERPGYTQLWGIGIGGVATIGPNWEARFLFSLPLINAGGTEAYQPFFNFSLTAQF